jgi:hypothetical protein
MTVYPISIVWNASCWKEETILMNALNAAWQFRCYWPYVRNNRSHCCIYSLHGKPEGSAVKWELHQQLVILGSQIPTITANKTGFLSRADFLCVLHFYPDEECNTLIRNFGRSAKVWREGGKNELSWSVSVFTTDILPGIWLFRWLRWRREC